MTWETGGLERASTIILVLQANRLIKYHPCITSKPTNQVFSAVFFIQKDFAVIYDDPEPNRNLLL